MKTKPCLNCRKIIIKQQNESLKDWENRHKYCSRRCCRLGKDPWNKNLRTGLVPRTAIKKGQHLSSKTQFKKNMVPWNKNTKGLMAIPWNKGIRHSVFGNKHWNWQGGKSKLSTSIRNLPEMKNWTRNIFKRDGFTCGKCEQVGGTLHAHHIISFSLILKKYAISTIKQSLDCRELWRLSNGKTLCIKCHKKTKSYLRYRGKSTA